MRRTPFRLREEVDKKLELLAYGIIEPVMNGPTRWVSPLVGAPKPDGDVHVCVDLRRVNEAIVRKRHPVPTVEDLLHNINGSIVFSKLDLKWGFHQVMLDEASRDMTTFVTHRSLFRYKRLMFGLCSAAEKYNKIIRDVLKNFQGCANIADDVIVYGKTLAEHAKNLITVLDTLRESGLMVNEKKCKFRLPKLTFFGHDLSRRGIETSEEIIAAIQDCESAKTASEARSFIGLVQYSAKFIPDLASIGSPIQDLTRKHVDFVWGEKQ